MRPWQDPTQEYRFSSSEELDLQFKVKEFAQRSGAEGRSQSLFEQTFKNWEDAFARSNNRVPLRVLVIFRLGAGNFAPRLYNCTIRA